MCRLRLLRRLLTISRRQIRLFGVLNCTVCVLYRQSRLIAIARRRLILIPRAINFCPDWPKLPPKTDLLALSLLSTLTAPEAFSSPVLKFSLSFSLSLPCCATRFVLAQAIVLGGELT